MGENKNIKMDNNSVVVQDKKEQIESPFKVVFKRLKKNKLAIVGLILLVVMLLFAIVGPIIYSAVKGYDCYEFVGRKYEKPSSKYILGTDMMGRDVLLRTMVGGQKSLFVGISAVVVEVLIGTILGIVAGYYGGIADNIIMRIVDIFMSIPSLPLLIILAAVLSDMGFPPDMKIYVVMFIIGFLAWPGLCRMVRGHVLSIREQEYMQAADALGIKDNRKMFKHILPNVIPIIIVTATLALGGNILTESALSYLGLGVVEPTPTWGNLIQTVNDLYNLKNRSWLWVPAGTCIFLTVMAINLFGDGLRDAIDPKLKK
ncbi:oligopeptide ABC transporter permease [Clostridium frigidicarnis]|uniref:Peptide/nickel transport system permease protein n=1 Tax=Clostridium frigidicarnis TaxID=84698 RepID=A0A1I1B3K6_9CLOT|nr:oligopeptide ABC transporter permease [Clostridium frigidicarnis]SFB44949.1 peptide/nickel transport system permease protein [Clostridium frigidicarnis]